MTTAPYHILHVETGRHLYGGALQALLLIKGLHRQGIRNTLVCPQKSHIAAAAASYADVCPVPMAGDLDPRFPLRLRCLLRNECPDLIHVHSRRGADVWTPCAARGFGIPLVLSRRVDNPEPGWMARWKYRPYERIITISEQIRQVLITEGIPASKINRVYSAVPLSPKPPIADQHWFRKTFAIPPTAPVIGVVAQLIPRKGHRYLIETLPAIQQTFPSLRVFFFGRGPHEASLKEACRKAGVEPVVCFAGFRRDMPRIMPCLDIVVHPAMMEGLGVALLEAAACARPVVAFRAGGVPEIVVDGESGFLVDSGDQQGLRQKIIHLLRNPQLAQRMGNRGRDLLQRRFGFDMMVNGNRAVYDAILGNGGPFAR